MFCAVINRKVYLKRKNVRIDTFGVGKQWVLIETRKTHSPNDISYKRNWILCINYQWILWIDQFELHSIVGQICINVAFNSIRYAALLAGEQAHHQINFQSNSHLYHRQKQIHAHIHCIHTMPLTIRTYGHRASVFKIVGPSSPLRACSVLQ